MAEESDSGDKTEEPTARRLQKARDEGQLPRSMELTAAVVTIGGIGFLFATGAWVVSLMGQMMTGIFTFDRRLVFSENLLPGTFFEATGFAFGPVLPLFLLTMILAVFGAAGAGGLLFSVKALAPKFSKLNPLSGFKRMFGTRALVELGKAAAKFTLVSGAVYVMLMLYLPQLLNIGLMEYPPALGRLGLILGISALVAALTLLIIAAIDVPYQRFDYTKRMRMSLKEVRDEMKEVEGNPQVRAKIRQRQREIAERRMMARVKDADVVVTNPDHFAVALSYDPDGDGAPLLLAKGVDALALRIRAEATSHGVREFRAPELARAIYYTTDIEQEIPEPLYLPVAQVLAYIFNLEATRAGAPKAARPRPKVPRELRFDTEGRRVAAGSV